LVVRYGAPDLTELGTGEDLVIVILIIIIIISGAEQTCFRRQACLGVIEQHQTQTHSRGVSWVGVIAEATCYCIYNGSASATGTHSDVIEAARHTHQPSTHTEE
jgi:hypothetical protein